MINLTFIIAGNTPDAPSPDVYKDAARRFVESYRRYPADAEHRLFLVNSNGGLTHEIESFFEGVEYAVIKYPGSGWDIGAHQFSSLTMDPNDWIMCFSSWAHFRRRGWLKAFVEARERFGDGLYGSTSSFDGNLHLRGTGFFVRCERMQRYPYGCNSSRESHWFEHGPDSLSQWCVRQGFGAWLVTPNEVVPLSDSRRPSNIFRRGDQSNIWTFDKHTDLFEKASTDERARVSRQADGVRPPALLRRWTRLKKFIGRKVLLRL